MSAKAQCQFDLRYALNNIFCGQKLWFSHFILIYISVCVGNTKNTNRIFFFHSELVQE